jgi:membrane protease YdiL (CAAX protease family)
VLDNEKTARRRGAFWTFNVVAVLFGIGHLPAAMRLMPITPATTVYIVSLNGIATLVFGYLYWRHGLGSAMLAHFSADIVLHVVGPTVVKGPSA